MHMNTSKSDESSTRGCVLTQKQSKIIRSTPLPDAYADLLYILGGSMTADGSSVWKHFRGVKGACCYDGHSIVPDAMTVIATRPFFLMKTFSY
eukprot:8091103-Pyramimonas_sp.AAC.1